MLSLENSNSIDPKVLPIVTRVPEEGKCYPLAIVGAGAAGTMAIQRALLNNQDVLLFTGAKPQMRRSRGHWVRRVDNVPGLARYQRTILELRNEVLETLFQGEFSSHLYVIEDSVIVAEKEEEQFKLIDASGRCYFVNYLVLATGIMDEQPKIQGSIRPILPYANGQTVLYCSLCDGHRSLGKKTAVIGYHDRAAEVALLLAHRYQLSHLTILTNGHPSEFGEDMLVRLKEKGIKVYHEAIDEVVGDKETKQLQGFLLENKEVIEAKIAFVALGIRPNNQLALQLGAALDDRGLVVSDRRGETSIPHLFVIGDLRSGSLKQIYTAWEHAVETIQCIHERLRAKDQRSSNLSQVLSR